MAITIGVLGSVESDTTNQVLRQVTAAHSAEFLVNFCNRNLVAVTVRLAICTTATPANKEWIIYDVTVEANDVASFTGLVAGGGYYVVVQASLSQVSINMLGYEE